MKTKKSIAAKKRAQDVAKIKDALKESETDGCVVCGWLDYERGRWRVTEEKLNDADFMKRLSVAAAVPEYYVHRSGGRPSVFHDPPSWWWQ